MKLSLIAVFAFIALGQGRIPAGVFPKCPRNVQDLGKCLIKSVHSIRSLLKTGIPEISFPGLDPFTMEMLPLDTSVAGIKLNGQATNIVASGAGNLRIIHLKIDSTRRSVDVVLKIPILNVTADYSVKGSKILMFQVNSSGKFTATFVNIKVLIRALYKIEKNGDLDFLRLKGFRTEVEFGSESKFHVTPNENTMSAKASAKMVNMADAPLLLKLLKERINEQTGTIVRDYVNKVLNEMPIQDLIKNE